ncbi:MULTISPECIES: hypothetical protein [unclassified Streptomyces]|uniref:hypothetical protein n=1 Tax=unclassified Streptomyces TaxID=2593676 RepID=UPI002E2F043A|nr:MULTISPECIES: hypothetical protein [unclassified Streptomyces]
MTPSNWAQALARFATFGNGLWTLVELELELDRPLLVLGLGATTHGYWRPRPRIRRSGYVDLFREKYERPWLTLVAADLPEPDATSVIAADLGQEDLVPLVAARARSRRLAGNSLAVTIGRTLLHFARLSLSSPDALTRTRARHTIAAALNARRTILESTGLNDWKPTVAAFGRRHLGLTSSDATWLEAVSTALLGDWLDELTTEPPKVDDALSYLRREASVVHRQLMPLWQRKSGPGRVWMLDYRLPSGETLHELVAGSHRIENEVMPWYPERRDAGTVFDRLQEDEQRVARAFAVGGGTWAEAATDAGLPENMGQRVMRKLRRLGVEREERYAASSRPSARAAS